MDEIDLKRQELLEQEMIDSGVNRYKVGIARAKQGMNPLTGKRNPALESNTSYGVSLLKTYVSDMAIQITADTERWLGRPGRKPMAWKYLSKLDHETCAFITCKVILDNISGITALSTLVNRIAGKIEDQTRLDIFKLQDRKYYTATNRYMKEKQQARTYQKKRKVFIHAATKREDIIRPWMSWPMNDRIHIGNALLEAFIKVTSDYNDDGHRIIGSGMIEKSIVRKGKKTKYIVSGTPKAAEWIRANQEVCQYFTPDYMPILVKPLDWTSPTNGGFHTRALQKRKPLVKMQQRKYMRAMHKRGVDNCRQFYDAVNTIQAVPWEINTFIYSQMLKEFKAIHGVQMPSRIPQLLPPEPNFFINQGELSEEDWIVARRDAAKQWTSEQKQEYVMWTVEIQKYKRRENERISEILNVSRTINAARRFAFEDEFYFVWTADFRSRLYACSTAITPQGTDKSKGVIKFKNGLELGNDGLYHLCIHAAGVYGNDKITLDDRFAWVMQNKEAFIETYKNPDNTRDFWSGADKPYCFLAVCEELGQILQLPESIQSSFISHIPCAQDGSCNGIQHYSAMLRDPVGSYAVNLIDSVLPSDIYMQCVNKIIYYINYSIENEKAFNGKEWQDMSEFDTEIAEGWLEFGIERDCAKKPTMVIPYGGTKIGCRDDCRDYLEKYTKKHTEKNAEYVNPFVHIRTYDKNGKSNNSEVYAITWLHHLVWKALDEVVIAARKAMKFLKDITRAVVNLTKAGVPIRWTTPTGFIVYQEIKQTKLYEIESHLEGRIRLKLQKDMDKIDSRRMQTSIAPNFVHSMDSSHLQLTVNLCHEMGINDFACIHDSFGVHAGNCTMLHKAIRHSFYKMHSDNVLLNFWYEQVNNNPCVIGEMPDVTDVKQGDFDLSGVLDSTHFFR